MNGMTDELAPEYQPSANEEFMNPRQVEYFISFSLRSGDRLGLVGSNGSGKTTLLRALSGIYQPAVGSLSMEGRLTSLLDPSHGMNMDLTGRENIRPRGYFLGLPVAEIDRLVPISRISPNWFNFSTCRYGTTPLAWYCGLAFAMATAFPPEILLMDEWTLAGDSAFIEKAKDRVEGMVRHAGILVLASHSASILAEWCNRVIWLDSGHIQSDGLPRDVLRKYLPSAAFEELTTSLSHNGQVLQRRLETGTEE
jgi:lipopolysaccharide transport system ATP-binding protein